MYSKTVAIIPARANSKGVPGKNLKKLNGIPLLHWTLHAAFNAGSDTSKDDNKKKWIPLFDMIVLTSEDDEILNEGMNVSRFYPDITFIPYKRDNKLSLDHVQTDEVCLDVLRFLEYEGCHVTEICLLQPTSPLRTSNHIFESYEFW